MKGQDQFIDFLVQQQPSRTNPVCVEFAIEQLGKLRASAAAPILIEFLDFPTPMSVEQEFTRMVISSSHFGSRYKAVEALFDIGEPALPSVMKALQDRSAPTIKFKNALDAYASIHREHIALAIKALRDSDGDSLCPPLRHSEDSGLMAFLEENKNGKRSESPDCAAFAILELGKARSYPAIPILIRYLDFEWPHASNVNSNASLVYERQYFPAVTALVLMGTPSLLPLLHTLETEPLPQIARSKGVETIMLLYAEYPPFGIKALVSPISRAPDKASAERMASAARFALQWCDDEHKPLCEMALRPPDRNPQ